VYALVERREGKLPWGTETDSISMLRMKVTTADPILLRCLPCEYRYVISYLHSLEYTSKVDYDYLTALVVQALRNTEDAIDAPFDWERLSRQQIHAFAGAQEVPKAESYVNCFPAMDTIQIDLGESQKTDRCTVA
jgi:hypothetical protein